MPTKIASVAHAASTLASSEIDASRGVSAGSEARSTRDPDRAERDTGRRATECEHDALDEHLRDDAPPRCAQCGANGDLTPAAGGAHEKQVPDVRAGDQHDEAHGREQNEQRCSDTADGAVAQGDEGDVAIVVRRVLERLAHPWEQRRAARHAIVRSSPAHAGARRTTTPTPCGTMRVGSITSGVQRSAGRPRTSNPGGSTPTTL